MVAGANQVLGYLSVGWLQPSVASQLPQLPPGRGGHVVFLVHPVWWQEYQDLDD